MSAVRGRWLRRTAAAAPSREQSAASVVEFFDEVGVLGFLGRESLYPTGESDGRQRDVVGEAGSWRRVRRTAARSLPPTRAVAIGKKSTVCSGAIVAATEAAPPSLQSDVVPFQ